MLSNLLTIVPGDGSSWAGQVKSSENYYFDNFGEPFLYALIGFVVVFVGIALLIFILWLIGLIMKKTDNFAFLTVKPKKKENVVTVKPTDVDAPGSVAESDDIPPEVKVAIMAAIMAYYEQEQPKCEFTVKRIKRL